MKPRSPALQADSPPAEPTREALSVRIVDFFQCFKNSTNLEGKCINKPIPDNLVTQSHLLLDSYLRVETKQQQQFNYPGVSRGRDLSKKSSSKSWFYEI